MYFFGFDSRNAPEGVALSDDLLSWHKYPEPIDGLDDAEARGAERSGSHAEVFT
jgi:hypothetical protein